MTLVLQIEERTDAGYPVLLQQAGLPTISGVLPADLTLGGPGDPADALVAVGADPTELDRLGRALYERLTGSPPGAAWAAAIVAGELRTYLDVRPAELRRLPWELMTDGRGLKAFVQPGRPCVRGRPGQGTAATAGVPIRVLVVVGDPDDDKLRAEDEVDAIFRSLRGQPGLWQVDVVRGPGWESFYATYADVAPHVLHFIGHAEALAASPGLQVRPPGQDAWALNRERIANNLQGDPPRLVVLNACRTTGIGAGVAGTVWSVADAFEQLGTTAVLAMQGDLESASAVRFADTFYAHLAAGDAVDVAAASARRALLGASMRDFALPRLTVCGDLAAVLPDLPVLPPADRDRLLDRTFCEVRLAIDRGPQRRRLFGGAGRRVPEHAATKVIGAAGSGKTTVLQACMYAWRLRGVHAAYADLRAVAAGGSVDWLDVVRAVRDAVTADRPDLARAAAVFSHRLVNHRQGRPARVVGPGEDLDKDDGGEWAARTEHEEELRRGLLRALRRLLSTAAAGAPLVLALDHVGEALEAPFRRSVVPHLLEPLTRGELPHVHLVLADCEDALADRLPPDLLRLLPAVEVPLIAAADVMPIAREYVAQLLGREPSEPVLKMAAAMSQPGLEPADFSLVKAVIRHAAGVN